MERHGILDAALSSRVTMVIGDVDTGKTTLVRELANEIASRVKDCAVIDADIGQSDIGPPGTIGLGRLIAPVRDLGKLKPVALSFVGSFSPSRRIAELLVGTISMVTKARELGCGHILIDTTGLISGQIGRRLKIQKIRLVQPDLIICIQKRDECGFLFQALPPGRPPRIISMRAPEGIRPKAASTRRENRQRALKKHLLGSSFRTLPLDEIRLPGWPVFWGGPLASRERERLEHILKDRVLWAEGSPKELAVVLPDPPSEDSIGRMRQDYAQEKISIYSLDDFENRLLGLYSKDMELMHLAVLKEVDFPARVLHMLCVMEADQIGAIEFGESRIDFVR